MKSKLAKMEKKEAKEEQEDARDELDKAFATLVCSIVSLALQSQSALIFILISSPP
jgi:hypothetical protein